MRGTGQKGTGTKPGKRRQQRKRMWRYRSAEECKQKAAACQAGEVADHETMRGVEERVGGALSAEPDDCR